MQTTTATLPHHTTLHFAPGGGGGRCVLTPRLLEAPALSPGQNEQSKQALKETYLECLKDVKSKAETLRQSIVGLLDLEVPWQQLLSWAKAAGRKDRYAQKLLSQILLDLGIRRREPGAGPKPPRESFLIERYVRDLHGERALKFLRAACHVAKARDEGELPDSEIDDPTELLTPIRDKELESNRRLTETTEMKKPENQELVALPSTGTERRLRSEMETSHFRISVTFVSSCSVPMCDASRMNESLIPIRDNRQPL